MNEKACRNCHAISDASTCPNCKSANFSDDFSGLVIIIDPEGSVIAHAMKITKRGLYALRIR